MPLEYYVGTEHDIGYDFDEIWQRERKEAAVRLPEAKAELEDLKRGENSFAKEQKVGDNEKREFRESVTTPAMPPDPNGDWEPDDDKQRKFNCKKQESPVWREFKNYRDQYKTNGEKGKNRQYYKWDHTHNDIEVFDKNGKHLGSLDPKTGKMYKGPVIGRIEKGLL